MKTRITLSIGGKGVPATEETARFEASLRGLKYIPKQGKYSSNGVTVYAPSYIEGRASYFFANPDMPQGREWWCEALKMDVHWNNHTWFAGIPGMYDVSTANDSRTKAISVAIHAAAAKWTEEQRD